MFVNLYTSNLTQITLSTVQFVAVFAVLHTPKHPHVRKGHLFSQTISKYTMYIMLDNNSNQQ